MNKISVIIALYNEGKYIKFCLESLQNQSLKPYEIIIVDDGSTDAPEFKIKNLKLKIFKIKHSGPAVARNFGAKKASGEILVFLDGDMTYDKNYIKELVAPIQNNSEIATVTQEEYVANLENPWAKLWDIVSFNNKGKRSSIKKLKRATTFRAIKASEFKKVHGFDNTGYTDDLSVLQKLHKTSKTISKAICYHYNPTSLSEVFYAARWNGRDSMQREKILKLFIFSFPVSFLKACSRTLQFKNLYFFPFQICFDAGYFFGLIDGSLFNKHYK